MVTKGLCLAATGIAALALENIGVALVFFPVSRVGFALA